MSRIIYESEIAALLILLIPLFVLLYYALQKRRQKVVAQYMDLPQMMPERQRRFFWPKALFLIIAYFFGVIALMQPEVRAPLSPFSKEEVNEVAFVLDVSQSMGVQDVEVDKSSPKVARLDRAKEMMSQIIQSIGGVNISLYIFQGDAEELVPSTLDYVYTQLSLKNLTTGATTISGTNLTVMLEKLQERILDAPLRKRVHVVLFTDGEDTSLFDLQPSEKREKEQYQVELLSAFHQASIGWSIIGVGTVEGGVVPGLENVTSHLVPETLKMFQEATKGRLYLSKDTALVDVVDGVAADLNPSTTNPLPALHSVAFFPLLFACFFMLLHLFIPEEVKYV